SAQARAKIGAKALALVTRDENAASRDAVGFCPAEHGGKLAPQGLPPGFRVLRTVCEHQSGLDGPVTHLLVGDGLAMVSVFIAPYRSNGTALIGVTALGAVHAVGRVAGGYAITAMGDAPSITISRIASAVEVTKH
ncbi:MAG TPA: MucB/RseB C-terminal domain-containing protein, partial [Gammaproteobacteria bacterium]|nr:MucB/RseB C-terminal domain-containing protein [Gammaproteobacteria bacterium]